MNNPHRPTIGLALSGSGNRTTFYIGFMEVLDEEGVPVDYIAASSGGSMVAAAYACGSLQLFKEIALSLDNEKLREFIRKGKRGGLYSLDGMEEKMRAFTGGKRFEEVRPLMSFVTVDIETGEQVNLCMGDIARASRISCTLPGVFEPVKWGSRTLVDGGLLNLVPVNALKEFPADITIAVNMRGTKHIFTESQITLKRVFNMLKRMLFIDEMADLLSGVFGRRELDFETNPRVLSVLGKSLDLAIKANETDDETDLSCDLMIIPNIPKLKRDVFAQFNPYYQMGRDCAKEHLPKIMEIIKEKEKQVQPIKQV